MTLLPLIISDPPPVSNNMARGSDPDVPSLSQMQQLLSNSQHPSTYERNKSYIVLMELYI